MADTNDNFAKQPEMFSEVHTNPYGVINTNIEQDFYGLLNENKTLKINNACLCDEIKELEKKIKILAMPLEEVFLS